MELQVRPAWADPRPRLGKVTREVGTWANAAITELPTQNASSWVGDIPGGATLVSFGGAGLKVSNHEDGVVLRVGGIYGYLGVITLGWFLNSDRDGRDGTIRFFNILLEEDIIKTLAEFFIQ